GQPRYEVGPPALHRMGAEHRVAFGRRSVRVVALSDAAREDGGVLRLRDDDARRRALRPQHSRDAFQRAAGAGPGDEIVRPLPTEIAQDLARGRGTVDVGIGLVLELACPEPAMRLGKLAR